MRHMPPEWHPHERTWVAFPHHGYTLGDTEAEQLAARKTWAEVANRASDYEPVTVIVHPAGVKDAKKHLSSQIEIAEIELDDAWLRDSGPTFVIEGGRLAAVDWIFNGWGAQSWAKYDSDALVAREIAELLGVERLASNLVNEGGGIHVDGQGRVLLTETVQLGKERNPGLSKAEGRGRRCSMRVQPGLRRQQGWPGGSRHCRWSCCAVPRPARDRYLIIF